MWDNITDDIKNKYRNYIENFCSHFYNEALFCREKNCSSDLHKMQISCAYNDLCCCIKDFDLFPIKGKSSNYNKIPGWNECCKNNYKRAHLAFIEWVYIMAK